MHELLKVLAELGKFFCAICIENLIRGILVEFKFLLKVKGMSNCVVFALKYSF